MIGRDSGTGLAKYGPGSVLAGQNVSSLFGTNDYIGQLEKNLARLQGYKNPNLDKINKTNIELQNARDDALQQELAEEEKQGRFNTLKSRLGKADGGIMNVNMNKGQLGETLHG